MNIHHAILGLLSFEPLTGYDIKKIMQGSPLFHWSGNNSQIYRALSALQGDGLIVGEVLHGDASPTKKRYALTETGRKELQDLSRAFPEPPEIKKPILAQLLFGRDLSRQEIQTILDQYERQIRGALLMMGQGEAFFQSGTPFQLAVGEVSAQNLRAFYESELKWIETISKEALPFAEARAANQGREGNGMICVPVHVKGRTYITVTDGQIRSEGDGLDLVSACVEQGTNLVLLPTACLSDDFLRLSTRVAGLVLQKLVNYNIRTAAVLDTERTAVRFQEFSMEANKGQAFRTFDTSAQAEAWLLDEPK